MASNHDTASMALFCDFENIALGVRDAQYEKFDIRPVLERLLAKGSIVVKKAYCDWDRYKAFKAAMHEANFELIEIPHVRQSGKNSADIRMVVDALDLCYTKAHVDTFVIISGDSDFSPLVSKLRENAKRVIGVGVKQSCSDLLVTNCDEFIYYDDLVRDREAVRAAQRREREKRSPEEEAKRKEKQEERKAKALEMVHATFIDLMADRGESERIWASVLKEVIKRRNPGFNESYFGYRTFGNLLEEAAARGLLGFGRDDKGAYVFRAPARAALTEGEGAAESGLMTAVAPVAAPVSAGEAWPATAEGHEAGEAAAPESKGNGRRRGGRRARAGTGEAGAATTTEAVADSVAISDTEAVPVAEVASRATDTAAAATSITAEAEAHDAQGEVVSVTSGEGGRLSAGGEETAAPAAKRRGGRRSTASRTAKAKAVSVAESAPPEGAEREAETAQVTASSGEAPVAGEDAAKGAPAKTTRRRSSRPRKAKEETSA